MKRKECQHRLNGCAAPSLGMFDHSAGIRSGFLKHFKHHGTCWVHIYRYAMDGDWVPKRSANHDQFLLDIKMMARAHNLQQANFLLEALCTTELWYGVNDADFDVEQLEEGDDRRYTRKFVKTNCTGTWFSWFVGAADFPMATPSQNTIEGWHKDGVWKNIQNVQKASTPVVLHYSIPKILRIQSTEAPPCT